jgi:hypothetical protein
MSAYLVDPQGEAAPEPPLLPVRTVAMAAVALLVIALAAVLFFFWLERPVAQPSAPALAASVNIAEPEPAPMQLAENEQLLTAPAPTCIDGQPVAQGVDPETCR